MELNERSNTVYSVEDIKQLILKDAREKFPEDLPFNAISFIIKEGAYGSSLEGAEVYFIACV